MEAEEYLHALNASTELIPFGQEINDQTFAICKADMLINSNLNHTEGELGAEGEQVDGNEKYKTARYYGGKLVVDGLQDHPLE